VGQRACTLTTPDMSMILKRHQCRHKLATAEGCRFPERGDKGA